MRSAACLALLSFLVAACGGDRDAVDKRLAELRDDIRKLQANHDEMAGRLESLEVKAARSVPPAAAPAAHADTRIERRPDLKVVRVVPGGESENASDAAPTEGEVLPEERPDAPGPRPVIRVRGNAKESRSNDGNDTVARQSEESR